MKDDNIHTEDFLGTRPTPKYVGRVEKTYSLWVAVVACLVSEPSVSMSKALFGWLASKR